MRLLPADVGLQRRIRPRAGANPAAVRPYQHRARTPRLTGIRALPEFHDKSAGSDRQRDLQKRVGISMRLDGERTVLYRQGLRVRRRNQRLGFGHRIELDAEHRRAPVGRLAKRLLLGPDRRRARFNAFLPRRHRRINLAAKRGRQFWEVLVLEHVHQLRIVEPADDRVKPAVGL